jgi:preprotein translocase subunit SecD
MKNIGEGKEITNAMRSVLRLALAIGILLGLLIAEVSCTKTVYLTPTPTTTVNFAPTPTLKPHVTLELVYQVDLSQLGNESIREIINEVFDVIGSRVDDYYPIPGAMTWNNGSDLIYVNIPGITDIDTANKLITSRGWIDFREMVYDSYGNPVLDSNGSYTWEPAMGVINGEEEQLTGQYVKDVSIVANKASGEPDLVIELHTQEADLLEQITKRLFVARDSTLGKPLGIFLDGQLISSPIVMGVFSDSLTINGLGLEKAQNLEVLLKSGPLPVPVHLVSSSLSHD